MDNKEARLKMLVMIKEGKSPTEIINYLASEYGEESIEVLRNVSDPKSEILRNLSTSLLEVILNKCEEAKLSAYDFPFFACRMGTALIEMGTSPMPPMEGDNELTKENQDALATCLATAIKEELNKVFKQNNTKMEVISYIETTGKVIN
jgi:hypothetical protein